MGDRVVRPSSGGADRAATIAAVRARLGWREYPMPDPSPAEVLPVDPAANLDAARTLVRTIPE